METFDLISEAFEEAKLKASEILELTDVGLIEAELKEAEMFELTEVGLIDAEIKAAERLDFIEYSEFKLVALLSSVIEPVKEVSEELKVAPSEFTLVDSKFETDDVVGVISELVVLADPDSVELLYAEALALKADDIETFLAEARDSMVDILADTAFFKQSVLEVELELIPVVVARMLELRLTELVTALMTAEVDSVLLADEGLTLILELTALTSELIALDLLTGVEM